MYYITSDALIKYHMLAIVSGEREVGGYAKYRIDEHGNIIVEDLRVLRQKATAGSFEIDATENAKFLEKLVEEGEDPLWWGMLFHTHPKGMDASMSGEDIRMLSEMARDLPGQVARSMILGMGRVDPMIHEAVCVEGRVFIRKDFRMTVLDHTDAKGQLDAIGWWDKPKENPRNNNFRGRSVQYGGGRKKVGFTHEYGAGQQRSRELVPANQDDDLDEDGGFHRMWGGRTGHGSWYDDAPMTSEQAHLDAYEAWLNEKAEEQEAGGYLIDLDDRNKGLEDEADEFIGTEVWHQSELVTVVDAYVVDGDVSLVLSKGGEVGLDEVVISLPNSSGTEKAS